MDTQPSADYKFLVVRDYKRKRAAGSLAGNLVDPTPATLKEECLIVFRERYEKKDENALRGFFGQMGDIKSTIISIEQSKTTKFIPLERFLKEETKNPGNKIVELVAWLIDFDHRPYKHGERYDLLRDQAEKGDEEHKKLGNTAVASIKNQMPITKSELAQEGSQIIERGVPNKKKRNRIIIIGTVISVLIGLVFVWIYTKKDSDPYSSSVEQCMYWTGYEFLPIACNQKLGDTVIVALDTFRLKYFKRIRRTDTMTKWSIDKLWYRKERDGYEYYTIDGTPPNGKVRYLRPLSNYIFEKDSISRGKASQ